MLITSTTKCQSLKRDGRNCGAKPLRDSTFCFFHDPDSHEKREAAQRSGGQNRAREIRALPALTPDFQLSSNEEVSALIKELVNEVLKGGLDPSRVREVRGLLSLSLRLAAQSQPSGGIAEALRQARDRLRRMQAEAETVAKKEPSEQAGL
jgi:hypothetical protein